MRPRVLRHGPVLKNGCRLSELPPVVCWPRDGGPFVTLPQVFSEDIRQPGLAKSNLGMYRVQLSGNEFVADREVGLHYQIHRGIGVHHRAALDAGKPFRVSVFAGGPPALTLAAVMPLPEGMSELGFAGALAGHRIRMVRLPDGSHISGEADFCITGIVEPGQEKPEGPFGDHLGYYSLQHGFPVLSVEKVWHRDQAIWPFTVVGRPPQEDTAFGQLIHELTGPVLPTVLPGVKEVHAVDAAGVHPLLLAIGSERYVPWRPADRPAELLTQASAILGQGQLSLAKYLWIVDGACDPKLRAADIAGLFQRVLERVDWTRDLHFQTRTTIDTLDYSGDGLNEGSKLVIAATGAARRELPHRWPEAEKLPEGFANPQVVLPGILVVAGPRHETGRDPDPGLEHWIARLPQGSLAGGFPLIVVVDDSPFAARSLENWLWVTFTRSSPASDVHGAGSVTDRKHWGCRGSLVIDARAKSHHAPVLEPDPAIAARIDALAARGSPLSKWL
jgi:4-hydroxy-3-polyprenylbenzoate decarboxylase